MVVYIHSELHINSGIYVKISSCCDCVHNNIIGEIYIIVVIASKYLLVRSLFFTTHVLACGGRRKNRRELLHAHKQSIILTVYTRLSVWYV